MKTVRRLGSPPCVRSTRGIATLLLSLGLSVPATAQQPGDTWSEEMAALKALNRGGGYAASEIFAEQLADGFRTTTYAYGNLMWSAMPFATLGAEYGFGRRTTKDGSTLDNHRLMVGIQVF